MDALRACPPLAVPAPSALPSSRPAPPACSRSPAGRLLTRGGNRYVRAVLGIPLADATGGFRAFRGSALRALDLAGVASAGYCFQVDLAWRAVRAGLRVVEVPIIFAERERGVSKM